MAWVESFEEVSLDALKEKIILAYPTETLWGLGVNAFHSEMVENLFSLKEREKRKPMSVLVSHACVVKNYAEVSPQAERLMDAYWPGPVTFVLPLKEKKLEKVTSGSGFIGFRCSSYQPLRKWLYNLDFLLTTTSANLSQAENPKEEKDLNWLPEDVCKVRGPFFKSLGSTVVKVVGEQSEVLRQGDQELNLF